MTGVAPCRTRLTGWRSNRSRPFRHAALEVFEVSVHLLEPKSERKEALGHVAGKTSR
jgi:hypothetical protein